MAGWSRRRRAGHASGVWTVALVLSACAPDVEVDPMEVAATVPEEDGVISANLPIRIGFSEHIAPGVGFAGRVSLRIDALDVAFSAGYDPVDRALVVVPTNDLRVGQLHTLSLTAEGIESADGRPLDRDLILTFLVGSPTAAPRAQPAVDFERDLVPLFAGRCGCHVMGQAAPPLTPAALVGQPSGRDPARLLVQPGDPRRSLLVQKVLRDYPGLPGDPMPPEAALSAAEQRLIVGWVEGLLR